MSEAELGEMVVGYASNGAAYFTIWLTILSAYAVTAHLAGSRLTSLQLIWLNMFYLFGASIAIFAFYGSLNSQLYYLSELKQMNPNSPQILSRNILNLTTSISVAGTLATLVFMWQIRHPRN